MTDIEKQIAALAALKDKVTEETLIETGRYFDDHYGDLTQCHHGDTGNYRNDHDGQAVALLWNLWKAGALDQLAAPPAPESRVVGDIDAVREALADRTIASYPDFVAAVATLLDELEERRAHAPQAREVGDH